MRVGRLLLKSTIWMRYNNGKQKNSGPTLIIVLCWYIILNSGPTLNILTVMDNDRKRQRANWSNESNEQGTTTENKTSATTVSQTEQDMQDFLSAGPRKQACREQ